LDPIYNLGSEIVTVPALGRLQSLPDLAYDHLREQILSGKLDFGAPLRQEEIAARLGISRLPVREALRRLDAEGLAVLRPRRGYVVASLNRGEIEEVFEIQTMLEERAGYIATQRRTADDIEAVEACLARLDELAGRARLDVTAFGRANQAFHERLFASSGLSYYPRVLMMLRNSVERYARMGASMLGDLTNSQREHRRIEKAFRAGDATEVARLCRLHRENTCRRLLKLIDQHRI
jgi:DNA-binding GntR family transcriptional regulator